MSTSSSASTSLKNPLLVWDCDQRARVNSLIKRLFCWLLLTQCKNTRLVRTRLRRLWEYVFIVKKRFSSDFLVSTSAKLHLLWQVFVNYLLSFFKPVWCSNFSKLSDGLVNTYFCISLLETVLRRDLTSCFFHRSARLGSCCSGRWLISNV